MLATVVEPPNKRQLELINKIWDELERLFGKAAKKLLKNYIEYNDGQFKKVSELAVKLEELRQLIEKRNQKPIDPEYLLPSGTNEDPSPEIM